MSRISLQNSLSTQNILNGFVFNGAYVSIIDVVEINVSFTGVLSAHAGGVQLDCVYSNDRINKGEAFQQLILTDSFSIKLDASYSFIKVDLTCNEDVADLTLSTVLKISSGYNDSVVISNFPASFEISNFPASTEISNFPASTEISNFPASTEISNFPASTEISNFPASTEISNFPNLVYVQELPTTLSFHDNSLSNIGLVLFATSIVLRNMSVSNTATTTSYLHIYDMNTIPTSADNPIFLIPIAQNVVSNIFNEINHNFVNGLAVRATTTYNNNIASTANTVFLNGTYSL